MPEGTLEERGLPLGYVLWSLPPRPRCQLVGGGDLFSRVKRRVAVKPSFVRLLTLPTNPFILIYNGRRRVSDLLRFSSVSRFSVVLIIVRLIIWEFLAKYIINCMIDEINTNCFSVSSFFSNCQVKLQCMFEWNRRNGKAVESVGGIETCDSILSRSKEIWRRNITLSSR